MTPAPHPPTPPSPSVCALCCTFFDHHFHSTTHTCSALEEQLHRHHRRHDALVEQIHDLQAKLQAVQQQPPVSAWQAASFLLFFLFFINFVGLLSSLQVGFMLPWTAAKASAGSMWIKGLLSFAVPFTNTLVTLIFCMQAIKAALTCLKW